MADPALSLLPPLALILLAAAFLIGPHPAVSRSLLRAFTTRAQVLRLAPAVSCGLLSGSLVAGALLWVTGSDLALLAAPLTLLFLMSVTDWRWRWLPLEWNGALLLLSLAIALQGGRLSEGFLGALITSVALLALNFTFRALRGRDGLGLGDILLIASIALSLPPFQTIATIGIAAAAGLLGHLILPAKRGNPPTVAFGTYLCVIFGFALILLAPL